MMSAVAMVAGVAGLFFEFRRMLMMLQQNSYRNERFVNWLNTSADTTSMSRLTGMIVFFAAMVNFVPHIAGYVIMILFFVGDVWNLARKKYKKPLVWTKRVWRLFSVMTIIALIVCCSTACMVNAQNSGIWPYVVAVTLVGLNVLSAVVAMVANKLLEPVEKSINHKFYAEAESILRSMPDLKIIGITGSYGKTSTKHYLYRILSEQFPVCMTPGSFNTTLGVVRTVREYLKPYDEVFIVEMGAKQRGDIKEICDLVHPSIGIVTAVGEQHLESFGSIENVQRTKFELIDSLPADGLAVINNDFPYVANRLVDNVECRRYAVSAGEGIDYSVKDVKYAPTGTAFTIITPEGELELHTRLVGECNISNLIAAVIVALYLNMPFEKIKYAVEKIEQVEHRLNMKRTAGGVTIIDDAFNSNPTGSGMALDVLASMTGGRRIVVTPGMIELGARQEFHNTAFGRKIAECADVAIIVGLYNRDAIMHGIE
ncbi:MAG: UDP-N-acetylmuramoyl-tripeptide--D-alanyl-D-alanine ligase, partial [Muribaculaceae bacterium]|nr:UDP-N-acetylmuramoyl-tripeptide--D-alanyl-D-alanine ligase [Muribaculaceae bacterium]